MTNIPALMEKLYAADIPARPQFIITGKRQRRLLLRIVRGRAGPMLRAASMRGRKRVLAAYAMPYVRRRDR